MTGLFSEPWMLDILKLSASYLLALPVGWDRERDLHAFGIRTFPLVAMASCGYLLFGDSGADPGGRSRILQGLITGIGFIGGGAILKQESRVHGTATAASIWTVGVMGAAVAHGQWAIAVFLAVATFVTLHYLRPLKGKITGEDSGGSTEAGPDSARS